MKNTIKPATTYRTKGGWDAHIFERGKNGLGEECWLGTEKGIGFGTWDENGKSLSDNENSDLILEANMQKSSDLIPNLPLLELSSHAVGKTIRAITDLENYGETLLIVFDDDTGLFLRQINGYIEECPWDDTKQRAEALYESGVLSKADYDQFCRQRQEEACAASIAKKEERERQEYQRLHAKYGKEK